MIVITCENGIRYGFEFDTKAAVMRVTKNGKVKFSPFTGVMATLEFESPAVRVEEGGA